MDSKENASRHFNSLVRATKPTERRCRSVGAAPAIDETPGEGLEVCCLPILSSVFPRLFTFTVNEIRSFFPVDVSERAVCQLLNNLSLRLGDLAETPIEHLFTQSQIRTRPFIALEDETYFIPVVGLLNSFFVETVETQLRPNSRLWEMYLARRSKFLETTLGELLKKNSFSEAFVETNLKWFDPDTNKTYETDALLILGPTALVFEAKSARVSDSARRGSADRLQKDFGALVDHASEQTQRLAELLEAKDDSLTMFRKGGDSISIECSGIRNAACISITLDWLPAFTLCWQTLADAGLVNRERRPVVSMSLSDLMVALEVLATPSIRLHYFWRRSQCERFLNYLGDEEDLLVYYLSNGFLPLIDNENKQPKLLWGNSDHLRKYYMAHWLNPKTRVPRPRRLLTPWWTSILSRVETLKHPDKWKIACFLLDIEYAAQKTIEKKFTKILPLVRQQKCVEDAIVFQTTSVVSPAGIILFAYGDISIDERNDAATNLAQQVHSDGIENAVVIGRCVNLMNEPYDFLSYSPSRQSNT